MVNMNIMATAAVAIAAVLSGCSAKMEDDKEVNAVWTYHGNDCSTKVVEIDGHKYVILDGFKMGGIVHAASCECMKK